MGTYLSLAYGHDCELPPGHANEVRTPPHLVEHFVERHTDPGDSVVDIFAGYGTTLSVAERLDRIPYGLEYDAERVEYVRDKVDRPENVRQGDALELMGSWFPDCQFCFTSPPFMEQTDTRNPFRNYTGESTYEAYLEDVERAFGRLDRVLAPGATVVVDVSNMKYQGRVTTLAWDIADRLSNVFAFEGETVVVWEGEDDGDGIYGYGYDHTYCLEFSSVGE